MPQRLKQGLPAATACPRGPSPVPGDGYLHWAPCLARHQAGGVAERCHSPTLAAVWPWHCSTKGLHEPLTHQKPVAAAFAPLTSHWPSLPMQSWHEQHSSIQKHMKKAKLYFGRENCSGPLGTMAQGTKEREED